MSVLLWLRTRKNCVVAEMLSSLAIAFPGCLHGQFEVAMIIIALCMFRKGGGIVGGNIP
jgi:hypothetical protein